MRDPYTVLGVPRDARQEDIQRAYRRLARACHPDVSEDPRAEERFKDVSEAYAILSDPEQRRRYDTVDPDFRQAPPDADPGPRGRSRSRAYAGGRGATAGFDDPFFGRGPAGWGLRGADQEAELVLSVEEAYRGASRSIVFGDTRTINVTIPPGVTEGQRIRVAGQGGRGLGGGRPGDLYLVVRIEPHSDYRVEGRDLHVQLRLEPWQAALGAWAPVATPGGEARIKVPPGTSSGTRLRLRGRGLPDPHGNPGDLYAEVRIVVPARLTKRERQLYEQLAAASPRSRRP